MAHTMMAAFLKEAESFEIPSTVEQEKRQSCITNEQSSGVEAISQVDDTGALRSGKLLIAACNDWENMTGKGPTGLDELHEISVDQPVKRTFSSSSSMHCFILLNDGKLMALGRNDKGQCGHTGKENPGVYFEPILVPLVPKLKVLTVSTGRSHSILLSAHGELFALGSNEFGQLGLGASCKSVSSFTKINGIPAVVDAACGHDFTIACTKSDGQLYSWGHPEYGQLGHGTTGSFIRDGGRGAAVQYDTISTPKRVELFLQKDSHNRTTHSYLGKDIAIRKVACGRNHSICIEDWEDQSAEANLKCGNDNSITGTQPLRLNRVFSFGFGGYGRLGHGSGITSDELVPREVTTFSQSTSGIPSRPTNPQKQVRSIVAGSSFSLCVTASGTLYHWGKMASAKGGESTMYPKIVTDLQTMPCGERVAAGHNSVIVGFNDCAVAWGAPPAGKFGLEGGARSSTVPKYVSEVDNLFVVDVSAGYGHVCYVVRDRGHDSTATTKYAAFPVLSAPKKRKRE